VSHSRELSVPGQDIFPEVGRAISGPVPGRVAVTLDDGHIGWTIAGRIPKRIGFDGRVPTSWADGSRRWDGFLAPGEYLRIADPGDGRIREHNGGQEAQIEAPFLDGCAMLCPAISP
jgi:hypothetical protein